MLIRLLLALVLISPLAQAATDCAAVTEIPSTECEALVALYNSTDGDNWRNNTGWNVTNTPCGWYKVSCSGRYVWSLSLIGNQLSGSIPPELGQLSNLKHLYLSNNQLSGTIPPELGQLSNLQHLWLHSNQLCGKIPSELMNLTKLYSDELKLQNNNLINTDTAYPTDFVTWLDQKNPDWRNQISPSYCSNDVVIDFGPQHGIWAWMNNDSWAKIHSLSPLSMDIGDIDGSGQDDIIIDFGETYGIWLRMNNSSWVSLHSLSAKSMTTGDTDGGGLADVIIDFGEPYGIWVWMNNSEWAQLHSLSAQSMTTGDMDGNGLDEVIIDFGSQYGIWVRMNNDSWVKLHSLSPESMTTGDLDKNAQADIIIDFGDPYGIWVKMNNSNWVQLHTISGEGMVTGNIDGQPSLSSNNITTQEVPAELDNAEPLPEADFIELPTE